MKGDGAVKMGRPGVKAVKMERPGVKAVIMKRPGVKAVKMERPKVKAVKMERPGAAKRGRFRITSSATFAYLHAFSASIWMRVLCHKADRQTQQIHHPAAA